MKINLNPIAEMTEEEKKVLQAFATGFDLACDDVGDCVICPLHTLRDDYDLNDACSSFIRSVLCRLGVI